MQDRPPLRFAVIGVDHPHIFGQVSTLLAAGGELVAFHVAEPAQAEGFARMYPQAKRAHDEHGSSRMARSRWSPPRRSWASARRSACACCGTARTSCRQARNDDARAARRSAAVQRETAASTRFSSPSTSSSAPREGAAKLVAAGRDRPRGADVGLGPHRVRKPGQRPDWFFDRERYGGVLADIASHQVDQFLHFTARTTPRSWPSTVANWAHPEHPGLRGLRRRSTCAEERRRARCAWTGTRPTRCRSGATAASSCSAPRAISRCASTATSAARRDRIISSWSSAARLRRFDCRHDALPFGPAFAADVRDRTETAMTQSHCFRACELVLQAQAGAVRLGHLAVDLGAAS